jgi:AcrR family transcriptional regulator
MNQVVEAYSQECVEEAIPSRREPLRKAALQLFALRGFARVGVRELAQQLGMGPGSFYCHFESKEQLLFELIEELFTDLLALERRREKDSSVACLQAFVQSHIALHERRAMNFLIAEREFHCLSLDHQQQICRMRKDYENHFLLLLREAGATAPSPVLTATVHAVMAWLNHLPSWVEQSGLEASERPAILSAIVLGSLSSVLPSSVHTALWNDSLPRKRVARR